jgi:hypothetical protein
MENSGSYVPYFFIAIVWEILKYFINKVCVFLNKYAFARKTGTKVHEFGHKSIV